MYFVMTPGQTKTDLKLQTMQMSPSSGADKEMMARAHAGLPVHDENEQTKLQGTAVINLRCQGMQKTLDTMEKSRQN